MACCSHALHSLSRHGALLNSSWKCLLLANTQYSRGLSAPLPVRHDGFRTTGEGISLGQAGVWIRPFLLRVSTCMPLRRECVDQVSLPHVDFRLSLEEPNRLPPPMNGIQLDSMTTTW
ncbi:hypothetical protein V2G26_016964 [Clonostachys chloroleuca]